MKVTPWYPMLEQEALRQAYEQADIEDAQFTTGSE